MKPIFLATIQFNKCVCGKQTKGDAFCSKRCLAKFKRLVNRSYKRITRDYKKGLFRNLYN
jgi:hypothetical protein